MSQLSLDPPQNKPELRLLGVAFERSNHGNQVARTFDLPWNADEAAALFDELNGDADAKDDQTLWQAAALRPGATRGVAGLVELYAAILDADCCDLGADLAVTERLREQGLAFMAYGSWSHERADKVHSDTGKQGPFACFRIVLPLSRPVSPAEYAVIVPALLGRELPANPEHYAAEVVGRTVTMRSGRERAAKPRGWDPVSARASQAYYAPGPDAFLEVHDGAPLDVDAVLSRPGTSKPKVRREHPQHEPTERAEGALARVADALAGLGFELSDEGTAGWCRSTCPGCEDASPSLTARANGVGVDLKCWAGCSRRDVLDALGLDDEACPKPATEGAQRALEQLREQTPAADPIGVNEAAQRLTDELRAALASRVPTVLQYPCGTGKSTASAVAISERVREGFKIAYAAPEHDVAHETRMELPPDVLAKSVHLHSPLVQVGDGPVCQRADELKKRVFELGGNMHAICQTCPFRDTCEARREHRERNEAAKDAMVIFVSHAGIGQVFGTTKDGTAKGLDIQPIVDEMPGVYSPHEVSTSDLKRLATRRLKSLHPELALAVQAWALGVLNGERPGELRRGGAYGPVVGDALQVVLNWGGRVHEDVFDSDEAEMVKAADSLLRIVAHCAPQGGLPKLKGDGISANLPDAAHEALVSRGGVLLTATPMMEALPGFELRTCDVRDAVAGKRVMRVRSNCSQTKLEAAVAAGKWNIVRDALDSARRERDQIDPGGRILFVNFKAIREALEAERKRDGGACVGGLDGVELAHFGGLRGRNDWQQGAERECNVVAIVGVPWMGSIHTLESLGLDEDERFAGGRRYAAGELAQAEGRLRLPRRTKPWAVVATGDVPPATWHEGNCVVDTLDDVRDEAGDVLAAVLAILPRVRVLARLKAAGISTNAADLSKMVSGKRAVPAAWLPALLREREALRTGFGAMWLDGSPTRVVDRRALG